METIAPPAQPREVKNAAIKRLPRIHRTIELRALGYTYAKIALKLKEEGFKTTCENTVKLDLKTNIAEEFRQELLRKQLEDIENRKNEALRLKWRANLLELMFPKQYKTSMETGSLVLKAWNLGEAGKEQKINPKKEVI